jgi:hypothetical protein
MRIDGLVDSLAQLHDGHFSLDGALLSQPFLRSETAQAHQHQHGLADAAKANPRVSKRHGSYIKHFQARLA